MVRVELPNVVETFHRALYEVLAPFLSSGNPIYLMGMMVYFYKTELNFSIDRLEQHGEPMTTPFISFVGQRAGSRQTEKCHDPRQPSQPFGYEIRQQVIRSVYAGIPRTLVLNQPPYSEPGEVRKASMLDTERIWSQLLLVLEHQHKNLNARGLFNPRLPAIPLQTSHADYYLVQGDLLIETRFTLTRNNTN